jgi:hypothetical protein
MEAEDIYSIIDGFPKRLRPSVEKALEAIPRQSCHSVIGDGINYRIENQTISFPGRVYFADIPDCDLNPLNEEEKMILHCIYTRHCDGYVREKHLEALLRSDYEEWSIPYIVKVCDEYVVELLELTYSTLKDKDNQKIKQFCADNEEALHKNYDRMMSYWGEYYQSGNYKTYVGYKLFTEIFGITNGWNKYSRSRNPRHHSPKQF